MTNKNINNIFIEIKICLETSGNNNLLQILFYINMDHLYIYINVLIWNTKFKDKHFYTKVVALYFIKIRY